MRPAALGTGLVVELDRRAARAVLFGSVEGQGRLIASASVPSTVLPPIADGSVAVKQALRAIEEQTGFSIFGADGVQVPPDHESGVNYLAVTGQPVAPLRLAIITAGTSALADVLVAAARCTNTIVESLGANVRTADGILSGAMLEQKARAFHPDVIVLIEGTSADLEWSACVGTLAGLVGDGPVGQVVIVAHDHLQQQAAQLFGPQADLRGIDPAEFTASEIAAALESELATLYESRLNLRTILPVTRSCRFVSTIRAGDLVTRFLARRRDQSILMAQIGDGLALHWAVAETSETSVRPDIDVHANARAALGLDAAEIRRWLPFALSNEDLNHWILNRALRPHTVSETSRDLAIEAAITIEMLRRGWEKMTVRTGRTVETLVAGHGFASWQSTGMAIFALLNAFQPTPSTGMLEVVIDVDGIASAAGAIGEQSPALAADAVEFDLMVPAAHVVVVQGLGTEGEIAVRGQLTYPSGDVTRFSVPFGSFLRIPLAPGREASLSLSCEPKFSVGGGSSAAGSSFDSSQPLRGSDVGIVIDARGFPLQSSADPAQQSARVAGWLDALGVTF